MPFKLITNLDSSQPVDWSDRGLHYGDGLFETMLLVDGVIRYWQEHYQRLSSSALKLNIKCPDISWFEQHLQPFVQQNKTQIIKIIITRGSGGRGLSIPDDICSNIYLFNYKADLTSYNQNVKAISSSITLPINTNLTGLKHLNRLDYVLASDNLKQFPEFDEALLADQDGFIIEGIVHNLFFIRNEEFHTPDLSSSGVDGVMRQWILKKLKQQGKKVTIGFYTLDDVLTADECFLCNSVQGIRPLIQIQQHNFAIGPNTRQLQQDIQDLESH